MVIGSIVMFAGSVAPIGWLLCDGSEVSRSRYQSLFSAIGTTHGSGDGSTTFNLPDIRGRVIIGASQSHAVSSTGGEESHSLSSSEIPSHSHSVGTHGHSNGITVKTPSMSHTSSMSLNPSKYYRSSDYSSLGVYMSASNPALDGRPSQTSASRTSNLIISNHSPADCEVSGSISNCDAFNTDTTGSGTPHNNMQPFLTMNYIIYAG